MCEYFLSEEISKIVRAFFSREKLQKCEYFSEYPKFGKDFEREHFKILVIKKRVKRSFSKVEKARKKKTYVNIPYGICKGILCNLVKLA